MSEAALIAGVTGQDSTCLAGPLLKKDYIYNEIKRRLPSSLPDNIDYHYKYLYLGSVCFSLDPGPGKACQWREANLQNLRAA